MPCRIFGYSGKSEADVHTLFSGFNRACANDPTLKAVAGVGCSRHCHGWGYVIHAENGLFHYRTATPVYEDNIVLPKLKGEIRAIFHARYASDETLLGHIFSHPFVTATPTEVIYLAHNGGVDPVTAHARNVDSEWLVEEIHRQGSVSAALPKLKERTKSALNLLILQIGRAPTAAPALHYVHYYTPTVAENPGKVDYYKMFAGTMPGGRAVVSSTFTMDHAKMPELTNIQPARFGELVLLG